MVECSWVHSTLEQASIHDFKRATEEKLRGVLCPEHHQRPRVRVIGTSIREAKLSVSGCCDRLMCLANHALANHALANRAIANR
jgi:hypothetical protein